MNKGELSELELKVLYYVFRSGPAFIKKLSARLNEDNEVLHNSVKNLQRLGYLERVTKTLVDYRLDKRNKVTKHRNHTYYDLTRKGRLFMRRFNGNIEVNLRPPYKQA
jgi:DNA-binding Lrp family transcriptional regulator